MITADALKVKLAGWKTVLVNGAGIIIPILKFKFPDADFPGTEDISLVVEQTFAGTVLLWSAINLALRFVTKGPVFKAPEEPRS